ncbi:methylmalonyl Co-A mutase-associated GTPase MeaB [Microbacter margulisiae]|uniref:LAO/AO transport system kinase n=1 Tax=Microbacter margulisiae TaxID=1350067 RepID=A0A7W5H306_9PORP|nr:methylmalonyl Co-A mutase-associated GTPase MeaB [Microbacter margulisiae]MBB3188330.1 LAO/AO transport system kinase [Microbacter margulisiae]
MAHIENDPKYKGLVVNDGIVQPPSVNPYLQSQRIKKRKQYSAAEIVDGIVKGNRVILSQAVTLIESELPEHEIIAQEIIERCLPYSGNSIKIGITGVPGAGKSTFIEALGMFLVQQGHQLAVLAIDPSSERTKGSILGDKTRMIELSRQPNAFIRPSPSAGTLGGVARKTRETILLCEAAGFNTIFVETMGVGQSETVVHSMVDFFLLLQVAGTGDELQGIKRGIMEMVDGIAINKAEEGNLERVNLTKAQLVNALHMFPLPESGWTPKVMTCSAMNHTNIDVIWAMILSYIDFVKDNGFFQRNRTQQATYWMYEAINEQLKNHFYNDPNIARWLKEYEQKIFANEIFSFAAASRLLDLYFNQLLKQKV